MKSSTESGFNLVAWDDEVQRLVGLESFNLRLECVNGATLLVEDTRVFVNRLGKVSNTRFNLGTCLFVRGFAELHSEPRPLLFELVDHLEDWSLLLDVGSFELCELLLLSNELVPRMVLVVLVEQVVDVEDYASLRLSLVPSEWEFVSAAFGRVVWTGGV